jgi:heme/copper-type cytochrome/quinol oxidase subunit 2
MEGYDIFIVLILLVLIGLLLYSFRNCRNRNNPDKEYYQRPVCQYLRFFGRRENRKVKK